MMRDVFEEEPYIGVIKWLFDKYSKSVSGKRMMGTSNVLTMLSDANLAKNPMEKINVIQLLDEFLNSSSIQGSSTQGGFILDTFFDCLGHIAEYLYPDASPQERAKKLMERLSQLNKTRMRRRTSSSGSRTSHGTTDSRGSGVMMSGFADLPLAGFSRSQSGLSQYSNDDFLSRTAEYANMRNQHIERLREAYTIKPRVAKRFESDEERAEVWQRLSDSHKEYAEANKDKIEKLKTEDPRTGQKLFQPKLESKRFPGEDDSTVPRYEALYQHATASKEAKEGALQNEIAAHHGLANTTFTQKKSQILYQRRLEEVLVDSYSSLFECDTCNPLCAQDTFVAYTIDEVLGVSKMANIDQYVQMVYSIFESITSLKKEMYVKDILETLRQIVYHEETDPRYKKFKKLFIANLAFKGNSMGPSSPRSKAPDLSFSPIICDRSKKLDRSRLSGEGAERRNRFDELHDYASVYASNKEILKKQSEEAEMQRLEELGFSPKIIKEYKPPKHALAAAAKLREKREKQKEALPMMEAQSTMSELPESPRARSKSRPIELLPREPKPEDTYISQFSKKLQFEGRPEPDPIPEDVLRDWLPPRAPASAGSSPRRRSSHSGSPPTARRKSHEISKNSSFGLLRDSRTSLHFAKSSSSKPLFRDIVESKDPADMYRKEQSDSDDDDDDLLFYVEIQLKKGGMYIRIPFYKNDVPIKVAQRFAAQYEQSSKVETMLTNQLAQMYSEHIEAL